MGGQSYVYTDGGTVLKPPPQAERAKNGSSPLPVQNRAAAYPLDKEIARVLVAANKLVTVKLYFKKSMQPLSRALVVRGGRCWCGLRCQSRVSRHQLQPSYADFYTN